MPEPITALYQSLLTQNWFASAALTIMLGIQIWKTTIGQNLYAKIPNGYRFLVPTALAMATAFVHGFEVHESFGASVWDAVKIALSAMGGAAALKESPLPWGGGRGGLPALARVSARPRAPAAGPAPVLGDDDLTPVDAARRIPTDPPQSD